MIRKINQASLVKYCFRPKVWNLRTVDYGVSPRFEKNQQYQPQNRLHTQEFDYAIRSPAATCRSQLCSSARPSGFHSCGNGTSIYIYQFFIHTNAGLSIATGVESPFEDRLWSTQFTYSNIQKYVCIYICIYIYIIHYIYINPNLFLIWHGKSHRQSRHVAPVLPQCYQILPGLRESKDGRVPRISDPSLLSERSSETKLPWS